MALAKVTADDVARHGADYVGRMERGDVDGIFVRGGANCRIVGVHKTETICSVGISDLRGHVRSVSLRCRPAVSPRLLMIGDLASSAIGRPVRWKVQESFIQVSLVSVNFSRLAQKLLWPRRD